MCDSCGTVLVYLRTYIQAELASVTTQLEELDRKSSGSERTVKDLKEQLEEAQVLTL